MEASVAARPVLPGVYPTYSAERRQTVAPNAGAVVAIPFTHNWGPVGRAEFYPSLAAWEEDYGTDVTPGRIAVVGAFTGSGLEGEGGAGGVLSARLAGAGAARASVALTNPTPAPAVTVRAKYEGARGNRVSIRVNPITVGVQTVDVLDGTTVVESYSYTIADAGALAGVVAQWATSKWLAPTAAVAGDGSEIVLEGVTGLAAGTFPLAGGADGATLTGQNWLDGVAPFQDFDFAYLAPYDLPYAEGAPALAVRDAVNSIIAWRDQREVEGHRFGLVFGTALDATPEDAVAMAQAISNPAVIVVGGPGWDSDDVGALSCSQMAPRYAGLRAFRGEGMSADMARLAGGVPRALATGARVSLSSTVQMVQAGVVVLTRDRYQLAPTRIAADVNTYQPDIGNADPLVTPADKPKAIFGNPKFVLSMHQFANDAQAELEREMIGRVVVDDGTRNAAAARVLRLAGERERRGAFSPGTIVEAVPGEDTDNFIRLKVTLTFGRALAQLFIESTVR